MKPKDITLTPLELIKSLGEFDLDPCGFDGHNTAKRYISTTKKEMDLEIKWFGRVLDESTIFRSY